MLDPSWLWALFTIVAAAAQTVRNATQRELTAKLGTVGATHVRFLFGFPFALIFLAGVMIVLGQEPPRPPPMFWPWVIIYAVAPTCATAPTITQGQNILGGPGGPLPTTIIAAGRERSREWEPKTRPRSECTS